MKLKNIPLEQYEFTNYESEILKFWLDHRFYKPEYNPKDNTILLQKEMENDEREPYCIICPPPNAYDRPHVGNLSGYAYQDAVGRYKRMNGFKVLLQPGKDHAGIDGEAVFIREELEAKGLNKYSMERGQFYEKVWEWQMSKKEQIIKDEKAIGLSADFDRDMFTLNPEIVNTVLTTFLEMYSKGMIYKGVRLINWDPKSRSAIADNQCERKEKEGSLFTLRYPIINQKAWSFSFKNEAIFKKVVTYQKTIETRAINPEEINNNFINIQVGDLIICKNKSQNPSGSIYKIVEKVEKFANLHDAFDVLDWENVMGTTVNTVEELSLLYSKLAPFYNKQIEKNGLIAVYFRDLNNDEYVNIATTRPETLFGDTAVAVNPDDKRYTSLLDKHILVPLVDRVIPIITDPKVEKDFGTGCLKITPAHSSDDYEILQNWNNSIRQSINTSPSLKEPIEYINVINKDLKLCGPVPDRYFGLKYNIAKPLIIEELKQSNLFIKEDFIKQNILISERTGAVVEPLISSQWFMSIDNIRKPVIDMVRNGNVKIHPKNMEKKFFHWMDNLRDWAISRSLWWGYRIPVWYKGSISEEINDQGKLILFIETEEGKTELEFSNRNHMKVQMDKPLGEGWFQDEEVLDTWFSSGQWPYATLMANNLMDTFYPTDTMVTMYDILTKWVVNMMIFGEFKTQTFPFKDVYLTGMVLAADGQKMSKSKRNSIPFDDINKSFGVDALRMTYFYQNKAGSKYMLTQEKLKNFRNFNNKMWNASKYVLRSIDLSSISKFTDLDLKILSKSTFLSEENHIMVEVLKNRHRRTTSYIEKFRFGLATEKLYQSFWHEFCDKYIEQSKELLKSSDAEIIEETLSVLLVSLFTFIKLLHPFIPFITEKIYQLLLENELNISNQKSLMYVDWRI